MSIALSAMMTKFNNLIGDNLAGTTTSNGNAGKTTFIDSSMSKYPDGYFGNSKRISWWAYIGTTLRPIKNFTSGSGTFEVYTAFGSQITSSTSYELHRYDRNDKIIALNQALYECYPSFYKRVEDTTSLDGQGSSDNKYTVPSGFTEFPEGIWAIDDSDTDIERIRVTDYQVEELGGTWYFYASISTAYDIELIGKTHLTQFTSTSDTSTTELSNAQAEIVCMLAASIFFRNLSGKVNAQDSGRFDELANRYLYMYDAKSVGGSMPIMTNDRLDWSHLDE